MGNICSGKKKEESRKQTLFQGRDDNSVSVADDVEGCQRSAGTAQEEHHVQSSTTAAEKHQQSNSKKQSNPPSADTAESSSDQEAQGNLVIHRAQNEALQGKDPMATTVSTSAVDSTAAISEQQEDPLVIEQRKLEALRLEQERLEMIVQTANQNMVPVRSMRGSNAYYDQGFAAALSQHLEQTTKFRESIEFPLPSAHASPIVDRLSQPAPAWNMSEIHRRHSWLEEKGILRKNNGDEGAKSPNAFLDEIAKAFLEDAVPQKEKLFVNLDPVVENLL